MRAFELALLCVVGLCVSGCGERHEVDLKQPSAAEVDAALRQFGEITPGLRTGRWEVAVSVPGLKLEGVDNQTADEFRATGKALNTTARCRKDAAAVDPRTETEIKVSLRQGCAIERLTLDPNQLSWISRCTIGSSIIKDETRISVAPESFVTVRAHSTGHNGDEDGEKRTLQYDGHHAGECRGDEVNQPAFWSDPL